MLKARKFHLAPQRGAPIAHNRYPTGGVIFNTKRTRCDPVEGLAQETSRVRWILAVESQLLSAFPLMIPWEYSVESSDSAIGVF